MNCQNTSKNSTLRAKKCRDTPWHYSREPLPKYQNGITAPLYVIFQKNMRAHRGAAAAEQYKMPYLQKCDSCITSSEILSQLLHRKPFREEILHVQNRLEVSKMCFLLKTFGSPFNLFAFLSAGFLPVALDEILLVFLFVRRAELFREDD